MAEQLSKEQVAQFKTAFSEVDQNGDGKIDTEELRAVMQTLGYKVSDEKLKMIMATVDKDGDGAINFEEFLEAMAKRMKGRGNSQELRAAFRVFDLNDDGHISVAELRQALDKMDMELSEEEVEEMVRTADVNQDGRVDYEEFVRMLSD